MSTTTERTFDREVRFDEASRAYNARTLVSSALPPRGYSWRAGVHLDQGREGACVGFAWAAELAANPVRVPVNDGYAHQLYQDARFFDRQAGRHWPAGASVLAGAKAARQLGAIGEFRWCFTLEDLLRTISWFGPVILGLNWYEGMLVPERALIRPTGRLLGGHAICARGVSMYREAVRLRNSWGVDWGVAGDCWLGFEDLTRLLSEDGEACVPLVRAIPPV